MDNINIYVESSNTSSFNIQQQIIDLQYEVMYREQKNPRSFENFSNDMQPLLNHPDTIVGYATIDNQFVWAIIWSSIACYQEIYNDDIHREIYKIWWKDIYYFDSFFIKKNFRQQWIWLQLYSKWEMYVFDNKYDILGLVCDMKKPYLQKWYWSLWYQQVGILWDDIIMIKKSWYIFEK